MRRALICSSSEAIEGLDRTMLWREDVERLGARHVEESRALALASRPALVLVDRDLPGAERLVSGLRSGPTTRRCSIAVMARGDFDASEVELLEAGANAVLRLPAGPDWDERLLRLLNVPARREARLEVEIGVQTERERQLESVLATMLNLSANGMLLECPVPLGIGDDLDFGFQLPDAQRGVRGGGRVVREAAARRYGVEFYGLEADGGARVRSFVERGGDAPERSRVDGI
jgi:hypothetical protein